MEPHDDQGLTERLRLVDGARSVILRAATQDGVEQMLPAITPVLVSAFGADGLIVRIYEDQQPWSVAGRSVLHTTHVDFQAPETNASDVAAVAAEAWRRGGVTEISASRVDSGLAAGEEVGRILRLIQSLGYATLMVIPLGIGDEVLGVLGIARRESAGHWSDAERDVGALIGRDLATVVLRARILENQRRLVEDLETLDRRREKLVATATHEIKGPLAAILGNLELAADGTLSAADLARLHEVIRRAATRMNDVVSGLLDDWDATAPDQHTPD
ncbi:hypothetical protein BH09ACT11_BH09ACT11_21590 [soil metagenome]